MRRVGLAVAAVAVQVTATVAVTGLTSVGPAVAASSAQAHYLPLAPQRLLDTRQSGGPVPDHGTLDLDVLSRGGVPASGVSAVVVNVTATNTTAPGFVQALPSGAGAGGSSTLNVEGPGQTLANLAVVPLGGDGRISLYAERQADLVVDVLGAFVGDGGSAEGRYRAVSPSRVLDTRTNGAGPLPADGQVALPVVGFGGVPPSGVSAVAVNVTLTDAARDGYVQVVPTGGATALGASSNLNVVGGQTKANLVMVPVGADGTITLYAQAGGHLIVDVMGWFSDASDAIGTDGLYVAVDPVRLVDTRAGGAARPGAESITTVAPLGQGGIPTGGVAAIVGNATATEAAQPGYVAVLPTGATPGQVSTLNLEREGQTLANAAIATLSTPGSFDLYTSGGAHVLYDAAGYFTGQPTVVDEGPGNPGNPTDPENPPPPPPPPPGDVQVTTPHEILGLGKRMVFSTVKRDAQPAIAFVVRNNGSVARNVSGISFSGVDANVFRLSPGTQTSFTLAPGQSRSIPVEYRPTNTGTSGDQAALTLATDDPLASAITVTLGGINLTTWESPFEPSLAEVLSIFGFGTQVGFTAPRQHEGRQALGDELVVPFWRAADTTKPVQILPIARYVGRTAYNSSPVEWFRKTSQAASYSELYRFQGCGSTPDCILTTYGGENQKFFPRPSSGTTFSPGTALFGFRINGLDRTDDNGVSGIQPTNNPAAPDPNDPNATTTTLTPTSSTVPPPPLPKEWPVTTRVYPALTPQRTVIPNTWILAHDKFAINNVGAVNKDYQDEVFLLTNAQPDLQSAGAPSTNLDFGSTGGTVADKDGQGTGFTSVMAASKGTAYQPGLVDVDPGAGVLRIRSTAGTASTTSNNQANALQVAFDATKSNFVVKARLLGPLPLTAPSQHIGIYVGRYEDAFMKLEVEHRGGTCSIVLYREGPGLGGGLIGSKSLGTCNVQSVDLVLTGNPEAGGFRAQYAVNGGALQSVFGTDWKIVGDPTSYFSRQAQAGVIVANQNTPATFTATYDSFSVAVA